MPAKGPAAMFALNQANGNTAANSVTDLSGQRQPTAAHRAQSLAKLTRLFAGRICV